MDELPVINAIDHYDGLNWFCASPKNIHATYGIKVQFLNKIGTGGTSSKSWSDEAGWRFYPILIWNALDNH